MNVKGDGDPGLKSRALGRGISAQYTVSGIVGSLPTTYAALVEHCVLHDDFGVKGPDGTALVISVEGAGSWPELAYDLQNVRRLWEDVADIGFWAWKRQGEMVLMAAELELAAWDLVGTKKWSTFVEPPWDYEVRNGQVYLDVMGNKSSFDVKTGPNVSGRTK